MTNENRGPDPAGGEAAHGVVEPADAEKDHVRSLEAEMASLRAELERQAAEIADNAYLDELTRRLNEAYGVLAAIEEAYLASESSF